MNKLNNIFTISESEIIFNLNVLGDLIYYDGPILSLYEKDGNYYFCAWTDSDSQYNRWMYFHLSKEDIKLFFFKKLSLLELIKLNTLVILVDIDNEIDIKNIMVINISDLPFDYLPSSDTYYDENHFTEFANEFKNKLEI